MIKCVDLGKEFLEDYEIFRTRFENDVVNLGGVSETSIRNRFGNEQRDSRLLPVVQRERQVEYARLFLKVVLYMRTDGRGKMLPVKLRINIEFSVINLIGWRIYSKKIIFRRLSELIYRKKGLVLFFYKTKFRVIAKEA